MSSRDSERPGAASRSGRLAGHMSRFALADRRFGQDDSHNRCPVKAAGYRLIEMLHVLGQESFAKQTQRLGFLGGIGNDGGSPHCYRRMEIFGEVVFLLLIAGRAFADRRQADNRIPAQAIKLLTLSGAVEIKCLLVFSHE